MKRRAFIAAFTCAALLPMSARPQEVKVPWKIGLLPLGSSSNAYDLSLVEAFRQGLVEAGLAEKRDFTLDVLWPAADPNPAIEELIRRGVQLLVPCGSTASMAARRKTLRIPILFISVGNPVGIGLVESLSQPEGNVTGFSDVLADLSGKYVDLAKQLHPEPAVIFYLWHTAWPDGFNRYRATQQASDSVGLAVRAEGITGIASIEELIARLKAGGAVSVVVQPSPFTYQQRGTIIDLASKLGVGLIYPFTPAGRDGALIAYGPDYAHIYRRAGTYVNQLRRGAKPTDLPVQEPVKFDLILNLKSARALNTTIPPSLIARADEVIE